MQVEHHAARQEAVDPEQVPPPSLQPARQPLQRHQPGELGADLVGRDSMTDLHFANFIAAIRTGEKLNAPVSVGNVAVTMLQLSNIAWEVNRELNINPANGMIVNDAEAMKGWNREYEKGWEPKV